MRASFSFVVTPAIASLPDGWELRLKPLRVGRITAFCLEMHDLLASKLAAGGLKDLELAGAVLKLKLANARTLRARLVKLAPASSQRARPVPAWFSTKLPTKKLERRRWPSPLANNKQKRNQPILASLAAKNGELLPTRVKPRALAPGTLLLFG